MTADTKQVANRKPPRAGMGRPKGSPNKVTKALKEMILGALDDAGGQDYLTRQATENPTAFLTLIGKVLPQDVNATVKATVRKIELVGVVPSDNR